VPLSGEAAKWLEAVAKDLQKERRASLVVAGEYQPAAVHALAHAINASLGNVGTTLYYTEPVEAESTGTSSRFANFAPTWTPAKLICC